MSFNSINFILFFPVVVLVFFVIPGPERIRRVWLLVASIFFYMCWNIKYVLLLFFSIGVTYIGGRLVEITKNNKRKVFLLATVILLDLSILLFFKYSNFILEIIENSANIVGLSVDIERYDILLPMGISFFVFQSLSYVIDVYKGEIQAERSIVKYALFVSFFPQLVAGPIERSKNLLTQLDEEHRFEPCRVKHGLELMLWGYFEKLVIADRIAIYVDNIFNNYCGYAFVEILLAIMGFAIQIYCDFGGYSHIAIGAAEVLGFKLIKNFNQPYLASSIKDFWGRWHISLSSWFRDYLYIPLGGSRKGFFRKNINILIVFAVSGLWHGAAWHYVAWGVIHGIYQVLENVGKLIKNRFIKSEIIRKTDMTHVISIALLFLLVSFAWLFFRAESMHDAIYILKQMSTSINPWVIFDGSLLNCGLDSANVRILIFSIVILLVVDIVHERGFSIRKWIDRQNFIFRFGAYYLSVMIILLFGIYGANYDASRFIYFAF